MGELATLAGEELPLVTAIILASNERVGGTIESVLGQDYPNFNCIVVEDEPIVDFARTVAPYALQHPDRFASLPCRRRSGSTSLDDAWRSATGHYVAIVTSDDIVLADWLSRSVSFMEANSQAIVGYPDWALTDGRGVVLHEVPALDYDFYLMVLDPNSMPSPAALIRRPAVSMPTMRNRSFRFANGYETWLLLGLQGDFIHIPEMAVLHREDTSRLKERVAEYRRASNSFFNQAGLPGSVSRWRSNARAHVAFSCAIIVAPKSPWTALRLLSVAFLASPRAVMPRLLHVLARHSRKLTHFGIPALVCEWIGHAAERVSARRKL